MPELPEVETVRSGLEAVLKGAVIRRVRLARGDLRIPFPEGFAALLGGRSILEIRRRAKYLLFMLDEELALIAHLGMSGRFLVEPAPRLKLGTHDHVAFDLSDGRAVIYNDARRFGLMTLAGASELTMHPLLAKLGPEPFDEAFSASYLKAALARRRMAVKPALMDQALVVGVGNIYASEALFLAGIDPRREALAVTAQAGDLVKAIRSVLDAAIASGGSSLRDFLHVTGRLGHFQHHFQVYRREGKPCVSCVQPVQSIRQAGRSTYFCAHCQT